MREGTELQDRVCL